MPTQMVLEKLTEIAETQAKIAANQDNDRKLLEKHSEQLAEFSNILTRNTITVEDHHKRSLHLERRQEELESRQDTVENYIKVQKAKKQGVKELFTWVGYIGSGIGAVSGLLWGAYQFLKTLGV